MEEDGGVNGGGENRQEIPKEGSIHGFESVHRLLEASLRPEIYQVGLPFPLFSTAIASIRDLYFVTNEFHSSSLNSGRFSPFSGVLSGFWGLFIASVCAVDAVFVILQEVSRLLVGLNCGRPLERITLPNIAEKLSLSHDFDLQVMPHLSNYSTLIC